MTIRSRRLGALAALALGAGLAAIAIPAADAGVTAPGGRAAVTCPTVNAATGAVTPAPAPGVDWFGCDLTGASLTGADLSDAELGATNLTNASLANANLTSADVAGATFDDTTFAGATLAGVRSGWISNLEDSVTLPANWSLIDGYLMGPDADLANANFLSMDLPIGAVDLQGANLSGASFNGNGLDATNLTDANLTGADLAGATLENVNVSGAQFRNADFYRLNLLFDNLTSNVPVTGQAASLPKDWTEAGNYLLGPTVYVAGIGTGDLSGLNLTGADLWGAYLIETSLTGSNLTNANLYGAAVAANTSATWSDTTCPDATNSDAHASSCDSDLNPVPIALATIGNLPVALGTSFWFAYDPIVHWNWTDLNGGINPGACPASSTPKGDGVAVKVTARCPDAAGGVATQTVTLSVDPSAPKVTVTGVRNRQAYPLGRVPAPGCKTTGTLSGVSVKATVQVTPATKNALGVYSATCTGGVSGAGVQQAGPVSAVYEVAYGFDGFHAPKPGTHVRGGGVLRAEFRLAGSNGKPLPAKIAAALARAGHVAAVLAGPGIRTVTARCTWKSGYFQCEITVPRQITSRDTYTLTATEKVGKIVVAAPALGKAANPLHFRFS